MVESVKYDSWSYHTLKVLSDRQVHKVSDILLKSGMINMQHYEYPDRPNFYFANVVAPRLKEGDLIRDVKYGHYKITTKGLWAFKNARV